MQITTPSGYQITLIEKLTYGDVLKLQKALTTGAKVELGDDGVTVPSLPSERLYDYMDVALKIIVKEVVVNGEPVTGSLYQTIMSWDPEDGEIVSKAVEDIAGKYINPQKKGGQAPSNSSKPS